jgi:23S rRNA (cytosine1962-C5)-methyltransferase
MTGQLDALPRVALKPRRALPLFSRHPWVFAGAVAHVSGSPQAGDEVAVVSHEGQFIARGLYNPDSNLRVRLYTWDAEQPLDEAFWSSRLAEAISLRRRLFADARGLSACRLVYSEGDGLSGLTVDRYGDWLVVQFTSRALYERRDVLLSLLQSALAPRGIWLRTEKGMRAVEGLDHRDGLVSGEPPPRPMFIEEYGLPFGVDIVEGQKTGFYFDQRENRLAVARYAADRRVLDLYCYTGGMGLVAAKRGGAREVLGVDSSAAALTLARENARMNEVADRVHFEKGDVSARLAELAGAGALYDMVLLDPPKLARRRQGLAQAAKAYVQLNAAALRVLDAEGLLVTCSCSGLLTRSDHWELVAQAALQAGRRVQVLESRGQAVDHPVSIACPEGEYLKCLICRVL